MDILIKLAQGVAIDLVFDLIVLIVVFIKDRI